MLPECPTYRKQGTLISPTLAAFEDKLYEDGHLHLTAVLYKKNIRIIFAVKWIRVLSWACEMILRIPMLRLSYFRSGAHLCSRQVLYRSAVFVIGL